jgi:hypothetical protein
MGEFLFVVVIATFDKNLDTDKNANIITRSF